jgi:hypothetical protein
MATQTGIGGDRSQRADRAAGAVIILIGSLLAACGGDDALGRADRELPDARPAGSGTGGAPGTGGAVTAGAGGVVLAGTGGAVAAGTGGVVLAGTGGAVAAGTGGVAAPGTGGVVTDAGAAMDAGVDGVVAAGTGGTTAGTGGATGTDGAADAGVTGAVAKFCHHLRHGGQDTVLTVVIGSVNPVRLSASTNTCSPPTPMPCAAIPTGDSVPITLMEGTTILDQGTADIVAGSEWLLWATLDAGAPILNGGELTPGYRCSDTEP